MPRYMVGKCSTLHPNILASCRIWETPFTGKRLHSPQFTFNLEPHHTIKASIAKINNKKGERVTLSQPSFLFKKPHRFPNYKDEKLDYCDTYLNPFHPFAAKSHLSWEYSEGKTNSPHSHTHFAWWIARSSAESAAHTFKVWPHFSLVGYTFIEVR